MAFYWQRITRNGGFPVCFPAASEGYQHYRWTDLLGIQIGTWFFGAIKGKVDPFEGEGGEG